MNYQEESPFDELTELTIDSNGRFFLAEAARWSRFMSILGFVFLVLGTIASLFMVAGVALGTAIAAGGISSTLIGFVYLAFLGLYFVPLYYLYQFGTKTKHALEDNNQAALTESLRFLRAHYRFIGIFTIVILALYGLMIVGTVLFAF